MIRCSLHSANKRFLRLAFVLFFLWPIGSNSHAEIIERIQAGIEEVAKGMDYVGQHAEQLIGPGVPLQQDAAAPFEHRRIVEEQYPLSHNPMITVSNEFGVVSMSTWNENVVMITAEIIAGGESQEVADQLAQMIHIEVSHGEDFLECRTKYPEVKTSGQTFLSVNYTVKIPQAAGLSVDNFFGDVHLVNIGGMIAAKVHYGGLTIHNAHGSTQAHVQGDFPVVIKGLHQGGTFQFQGVSAELSDIQGTLDIRQFRGKLNIRKINANADISVNCDTTQTSLSLTPDSKPDLSAVILYGRLESELDVTRTLQGARLTARHPNSQADQKIAIIAAFSEIAIGIEGAVAQEGAKKTQKNKAFTDIRQETVVFNPDDTVQIDAVNGNIRIEGEDTDHIFIEATRVAWTPSAAAALDALDSLQVLTEHQENNIYIETRTTQDMAVFDCHSYRIDLRLVYPREMPLTINAAEGATSVEGIGNGLVLNQQKGAISLQHIKGALKIENAAGDIQIQDCSGPIDAVTSSGILSMERVFGDIETTTVEGSVYLDAPYGNVFIRHKSGDVRILCLEPIQGNLDVLVEDGNLNTFIAPDSDASLNVKAASGIVQSSLSLSGTINREYQEFFGRLNTETHTVRLETLNGDIFLN